MVSMRLNLADPDQEPSDEQLECLMKGFLADVLEKEAKAKQTLEKALRDAFAQAQLRNGLEEAQTNSTRAP
jgi:hypothetical protein